MVWYLENGCFVCKRTDKILKIKVTRNKKTCGECPLECILQLVKVGKGLDVLLQFRANKKT